MDYFHEAGLIDSIEGIQLKVYANNHPKGFVIAKPKYIPSSLLEFVGLKKRFIFSKRMTRFNLFTKKEIAKANFELFKQKFPEYVYYCPNHKNWFFGVPEKKINKIYNSKEGLKELMKIPIEDLDDYLKATKEFIELIMKSGVILDNIGISHSTLLGNYTLGKSDIDIIIFGKENGWKVLNFLETAKHPLLKWKTKEDWEKYYEQRIVSNFLSKEEYVSNMIRKKDDGFFDGNVFSIFVAETENEMWYDWECMHNPLATVKIAAIIKNHYNSAVRPGFYEISNSKILEGYEDVPIKRIVVWSRPFSLQARKGEKVEAVGLLEKITSEEGEFYQIVIGYFDAYITERGEREYLKTLII